MLVGKSYLAIAVLAAILAPTLIVSAGGFIEISTFSLEVSVLGLNVTYVGNKSLIAITKPPKGFRTSYTHSPGKPILPYLVTYITAPPGYSVESVRVVLRNPVKVVLRYPPITAPPPITLRRQKVVKYSVASALTPYPPINYSTLTIKWRGAEYAVLKVYIARYVGNETLVTYSEVSVSASFRETRYVGPVDLGVYNYLREQSINRDYLPPVEVTQVSYEDSGIIILTRDSLVSSTALQDYVALRSKQYGDVKLVTLEEIVNSGVGGRDIPEMVRNYIENLYLGSNGLYKYLLIVGDVSGNEYWPNGPTDLSDLYDWEVPTRYFYNPDGTASDSHSGDYTPSDLYYVTLDTDWDGDGDGIYGEVGDGYDWGPELAVGRVPARSVSDVDAYFNALMNYSRTSIGTYVLAASILSYFNEDGQGDYGNQGDTLAECLLNDVAPGSSLLSSSTIVRLYEHYPADTKIDSPTDLNGNLSEDSFVNALTTYTPGLTSIWGHGSKNAAWRKVWDWDDGDGVPEDDEMLWSSIIDTASVPQLGRDSLVTVMACLTAYYDDPTISSLGEVFLRDASLWYVGWDRVTWGYAYSWPAQIDPDWWGLSEGLIYRFIKELLTDDSTYRQDVGMSLTYALTWLAGAEDMTEQYSRKVWWAATLLGDPSQPLAKAIVNAEVVDAPSTAVAGEEVVVVARLTLGSGDPLEGATATLEVLEEGGTSWVAVGEGVTNSTGYASISWTPTSAGNYSLRVSYAGSNNAMPTASDPVDTEVLPAPVPEAGPYTGAAALLTAVGLVVLSRVRRGRGRRC